MIEEEVAKKTIREWLEDCLKQKRVGFEFFVIICRAGIFCTKNKKVRALKWIYLHWYMSKISSKKLNFPKIFRCEHYGYWKTFVDEAEHISSLLRWTKISIAKQIKMIATIILFYFHRSFHLDSCNYDTLNRRVIVYLILSHFLVKSQLFWLFVAPPFS